ncbi:MAG: class A beta-lactamase-related serine hydrolase [Planctomycetota bacterium]|nr:MAG: class A beta-lactamase-related serine hydrolase [Planctomycetota bacterium]
MGGPDLYGRAEEIVNIPWSIPVVLTLIATIGCTTTQREVVITDQQLQAVRAIGERFVTEAGIVGLSIGISVGGEIVFAEGFGHADAVRSIAVDEHTLYDIASVGKQFTAVAILSLLERGALSLEDRVRAYVPDLPAHFPDATINQLLRHTSGFVSGELDELNPPADYRRPRYGLKLLTDVELQTGRTIFRPEENFVYSNAGYLVLGLVVEAASGRRYDQYIRDQLLIPNQLEGMLVCERGEPPRMSQALHRTSDEVRPVPHIDMTAYSGQGAICTSVIDLLRWSHALNSGRILKPTSLKLFRSPSTLGGDHAELTVPYGMAQRLGHLGGHVKAGHSGTFDGGSATLMVYLQDDLEIAVIANTRGDGTPHAYRIELEIAKLLFGIALPDVSSQRRPLDPKDARRVAGTYSTGADQYEAAFEKDELIVLQDGRPIERLVHIGSLRFRSMIDPSVLQSFILDGDGAGWWIYDLSGNYLEVLRALDRKE